MNVGFYATKIQALVMEEREDIESAYDRHSESTLFWSFVDLAESSNYRLANGPKMGYVRSETFFSLIKVAIGASADVRLVKEIGDEVFLCSASFRRLFESLLLIDQTTQQLSAIAGTQQFPFEVRACIGFGPAKRLMRPTDDFVGTCIDQLSRLMKVSAKRSRILLHEDAYTPSADVLREYDSVVQIGESKMVSSDESKNILKPIYYRECVINRAALVEFREHFVPWKRDSAE